MGFSGPYVEKRTGKNRFFKRIDMLVDRSAIEKELLKVSRGKATNAVGNASYSPVILFKMMLLQRWYGLRDMGVEDMVNENLSAMQFCGLIEKRSLKYYQRFH